MNELTQKDFKIIRLVGVLLSLFLIALIITKVKEYHYIGSGTAATNTITVAGDAKLNKSPDTAKVSFSVRVEQKDLAAAQKQVSTKIDTIKKDLLALGVEDQYIKTDSYTSYPQYDYPQVTCMAIGCPRPGTPTLRGYEVSHSITVSIKDLTKVEGVLGALGKDGVTDMQGPNFGFDDDKAVAREARDMAIADAKSEAQKLAKSLGVRLVRIVSFSESGSGGYPVPMYAKDAMGGATASSAPTIPVGDQTVQSHVTVVYEIR